LPGNTPAVPAPAARNIEAIAALEREALHDRSRLDRQLSPETDDRFVSAAAALRPERVR
jgi:hypothetical protein